MRTAWVIGSGGQDGKLLAEELGAHGWSVLGTGRELVTRADPGVPDVGAVDVLDRTVVDDIVALVRPHAVFYLAAVHRSSDQPGVDDAELLRASTEVHVQGWAHVLEALTRRHKQARALYAASSHVFGEPHSTVQNERTPFAPVSIYGITKAAGVQVGRLYRRAGLHTSCALLYNHESPLRRPEFASRQIVLGAVDASAAVREGREFSIEVGSFEAVADWGWAPDYVRAMRLMVEQATGDDYVVATGEPHTIRDFCRVAFEAVGLDHALFVRERPERLTRATVPLVGDSRRLRRATGWRPSVSFEQMIHSLIDAERLRLDK